MIKSTYLTVEASSLFIGRVIMQCSGCVPNRQLLTETASTSRSMLLALVLEAMLHSVMFSAEEKCYRSGSYIYFPMSE